MALVRDIFLFCCYTGLAYADIEKLKQTEIIKGNDGGLWIIANGRKQMLLRGYRYCHPHLKLWSGINIINNV
jgi:hypothetical protein